MKNLPVKILKPDSWLRAVTERETAATVTLSYHYANDSNWTLPLQTADVHVIWFLTAGSCKGTVEDTPFLLEPGDLLWTMPGTRREFRITEGCAGMTVYGLRVRAHGKKRALRLKQDAVYLENAWDLGVIVKTSVFENSMNLPHKKPLLHAKLIEFFCEALRAAMTESRNHVGLTKAQCLIISHYVHHHISERVTSTHLAKRLGWSRAYFARRFRETYGMSVREWLLRRRIERAALRLLESSLSISEIAYEFGYKDLYLFSKQFKKVLGVSPRQYRRLH
jgi:AraC-like DNA-binding protein